MSEDQEVKKPSNLPAPPQSDSSRSSKNYEELLQGFEEIRKIQVNQEIFKKRSSTDSSFETLKKTVDKQDTPSS